MNKDNPLKSNKAIYVLWAISFAFVLFFFIHVFVSFSTLGSGRFISNTTVTASYSDSLKPVDEQIPGSLPHDRYKRLTDSVETVRRLKNGSLGDMVFSPFGGAGKLEFLKNGAIGHKRLMDLFSLRSPESYFYVLKGWKLKLVDAKFGMKSVYYVENGIPFFRQYVLRSTRGNHTDWVMKESRLGYFYDKESKSILLPLSKGVYDFAKYGSIFFMFAFMLMYMVVSLVLLKMLYNIAKGRFFIPENVKMLRQATFITLITPLLFVVIKLGYFFLLDNFQDGNIELDMDVYKQDANLLFIGIAVSVLFAVFLRGFKIQQENDLVV
ncbi:MAG TPA: DUF2975 domain-containing protein [Paludibacter sp.]|nr:DUF2975 domain-containing protein [Paludibacter sp.]